MIARAACMWPLLAGLAHIAETVADSAWIHFRPLDSDLGHALVSDQRTEDLVDRVLQVCGW
jgi:hypothetical protein